MFVSENVSAITALGKRLDRFQRWEPIFIGTNSDPLYDERLSWEGRSDKMTQVINVLMTQSFHKGQLYFAGLYHVRYGL